MESQAEKIALFRYGLIAPLVLEPLPRGELTRRAQEIAARHYEIPGSQRTAVTVDTLLDWALRYRRGGFEALAPQAAARPGTVPHHFTATRRSHRTAETRESASHRHHPVARTGAGVGPRHGRPVGLHPLPLPQTARPLGTSTARSARPQEVRGRTLQPDLAVRHALRPLRAAPRRRENAGLLTRHPG